MCNECRNKLSKKNIPEYNIWTGMKCRCYNKNDRNYKNYGGRGIKVSDEWINSFDTFFKDMGERPSNDYSIDRIDCNGNYCKCNCRWADISTQANNRTSNVLIEYKGETMNLSQWANRFGIKYDTLRNRYVRGDRGDFLFREVAPWNR